MNVPLIFSCQQLLIKTKINVNETENTNTFFIQEVYRASDSIVQANNVQHSGKIVESVLSANWVNSSISYIVMDLL